MQHAVTRDFVISAHRPRFVGMLLAMLCTGCYSPGPIGSASRPNVIVLRGTAGYFPELSEFEERLLDEGVCPTVAYPDAYSTIAERVIGGRNRGRLNGPVVIVGYSAGANAAISLSRRLSERGIDVDKLVLLEATSSEKVPGNVHACFNIYKTQPWYDFVPAFGGIPVARESGATELVNYNVRDYNDGRFDWENHLTLAANPDIQALMVEEVLVAFDPPAETQPGEVPSEENPDENADEVKMSRSDKVAPQAEQPEDGRGGVGPSAVRRRRLVP
jgi:pimeloyl-ACP methyl ester carboxylesterase